MGLREHNRAAKASVPQTRRILYSSFEGYGDSRSGPLGPIRSTWLRSERPRSRFGVSPEARTQQPEATGRLRGLKGGAL